MRSLATSAPRSPAPPPQTGAVSTGGSRAIVHVANVRPSSAGLPPRRSSRRHGRPRALAWVYRHAAGRHRSQPVHARLRTIAWRHAPTGRRGHDQTARARPGRTCLPRPAPPERCSADRHGPIQHGRSCPNRRRPSTVMSCIHLGEPPDVSVGPTARASGRTRGSSRNPGPIVRRPSLYVEQDTVR